MATFGRFEAVREIHRTGYTTVYTGRSPESTAEKYAIKVFQPPALLLEGGQAKTETDLFLKSTEAQQKAAAGDSQHWAPIHQHGSSPGGAFYVTEKYEHSLQQLIDIRLKLSSKVLSAIVESVAKGLMELKESCGRPHGNLKATNVLISGTEDISQGKIVLCDPLPDELIDTEVHWDRDLQAIAELIYQLVVHQQSPRVDGWQAPDSKEWRSLGRNAASWRNLCNRLLSAAAKPGTITIETVIEELALLKTEKPFISPLRLITAALVVIVCVLALVIFWPSPPATKEEWKQLYDEYSDWVGILYEQGLGLNKKMGNSRAERWREEDQHLKTILKSIKAAGYPYEFAINVKFMDVQYIVNTPGDRGYTNKGLSAIKDIKNFFNPDSNSPWPLLLEIHEAANRFEEQGWEKPAEYLVQLVTSVRPEPNKPIAENVDKILNLNKENTLDEIESSQKQIAKYQTTVKSINDPILNSFNDEFVNREITSITGVGNEESLSRLQNKLEEIEVLGRKLAELIKDDWQTKVNQEEFLPDYNELFPDIQTPTVRTYNRWLEVVRDYYKLDPDPLEDIDEALDKLQDNIDTAKKFQLEKANILGEELKQEEKNIEEIRQKPSITKYQDEIEKMTDDCLDTLKTINRKVLALIVDPIKWWEDTEKTTKITQSNVINTEWNRRRVLELSKHNKSNYENKNNMEIFFPLMNKVNQTRYRLENLNSKLVPNITTTLKQTDWNTQLGNLYQNRREILLGKIIGETDQLDDTPDPNSLEFKNKWTKTLSDLNNWQNTLGQLITAFNTIQERLDICFLLDDKPTQQDRSIRSLWEEWKDTNILKEPEINTILTKLTQRIEVLLTIERSEDGLQLVGIATNSNSHTEVVLAAWIKLGDLRDTKWPNDVEDVKKDRAIRATLKTEFETIRQSNEGRGAALLKTLAGTGIDREAAFIKKKSAGDKILTKFDETAGKEKGLATLAELEKLGVLAAKLADFVSSEDWPQKFRLDLLAVDQSPLYNKSTLTTEDFERWLREAILYKKLEQDPRTAKEYDWIGKIADITKLVEDEIGTKEEDSSKRNGISLFGKITEITRSFENVLGGKQSDSSKKKIANLKLVYDQFKVTAEEVNNLLALPAIEKYKDKIDANICKDLWDKLLAHEANVKSIIKPEYCKYLELIEDKAKKIQHLVFDEKTTEIYKNFEPLNYSQLQSSDESVLSLPRLTKILNNLTLEQIKNLFNETVKVADWDEIRQAINGQKTKWLDFFDTVDLNKAKNVGWPKYIVSKKDPSVVLRFIPAGSGNPEPFYMAIQEITNAQYKLFLEETKAQGTTSAIRWKFLDQNNELVSGPEYEHQYRDCKIKWNKTSFIVTQEYEDFPMTWVTYDGATTYANWLGGQLPTTSQHEHACRAVINNIYPWESDEQISSYAHVRGPAYLKAVEEYNAKLNDVLARKPPPPVGAVKPDNFLSYQTKISDVNTVHENYTDNPAWPVASADKENKWGFYDMIGNVWEWCRVDEAGMRFVICGGSCLSPPEHARPDSKYEFQGTDCDVGFRIAVAAE